MEADAAKTDAAKTETEVDETPPIFLVVSGDQSEIFLGYSYGEEAEGTAETEDAEDKSKAQTLHVITQYNLRKDTMKLLMDAVKFKCGMENNPTMFIAFSDKDVMYGALGDDGTIHFCKLEIQDIIEYFSKLLETKDLASLHDKMKSVLAELIAIGSKH